MKTIKQNLPKCQNCAVREMALFGELETQHLDKARALRTSQIIYSAGEYLYHEGDTPSNALTIYQGWVILFKNLVDGSRQILRFALAGDLLSYKTGKKSRLDHSAIAVTDVTACAFPIQGFNDTIAELPELFFAIHSVTDTTTSRCYSTLTSIAKQTAEAKVAYLLLSLFIRERSLNPENDKGVIFPITQEDVGDALGLTAIHINRVFQSLRKKGLIECRNKNLWVGDQYKLAEIANTDLAELKKLLIAV